jgi:hypothetical protein
MNPPPTPAPQRRQTNSQSSQSSNSQSGSNNQSGQSGSQSRSGSTNGTSTSALVIPQSAPAGLITVTQPPQTATSYYKIAPDETITFAWNFSYVLATPTHLTVSAVCDNGNTYAVGPSNGVIPGNSTSILWDIWSYNQAHSATPLAQATYVLEIWDDRGPGATRKAGYLSPNSALTFAMYTPQGYTPLASGMTTYVSFWI